MFECAKRSSFDDVFIDLLIIIGLPVFIDLLVFCDQASDNKVSLLNLFVVGVFILCVS